MRVIVFRRGDTKGVRPSTAHTNVPQLTWNSRFYPIREYSQSQSAGQCEDQLVLTIYCFFGLGEAVW